jgi:hypothetical protein
MRIVNTSPPREPSCREGRKVKLPCDRSIRFVLLLTLGLAFLLYMAMTPKVVADRYHQRWTVENVGGTGGLFGYKEGATCVIDWRKEFVRLGTYQGSVMWSYRPTKTAWEECPLGTMLKIHDEVIAQKRQDIATADATDEAASKEKAALSHRSRSTP